MGKVKLLLLVLLAALFTVSTGLAADKNDFKVKLSPKEEVQKPKSKASGKAEFNVTKDGKEIVYKVEVKNLVDATAAHIHLGKKGQNGPPVVGLFSAEKKGKFSGVLAEGTITDKDLMGDLKGKPVAELVNLMRAGGTYVNVHSGTYPDGEIRGQIK
jgi:hypothetical protein